MDNYKELEEQIQMLQASVNINTDLMNRMKMTIWGDNDVLSDGLVARVLSMSQKVDGFREETYKMIQELGKKIEIIIDERDRELNTKQVIEQERTKWLKIAAVVFGSGQLIEIARWLIPVIQAAGGGP